MRGKAPATDDALAAALGAGDVRATHAFASAVGPAVPRPSGNLVRRSWLCYGLERTMLAAKRCQNGLRLFEIRPPQPAIKRCQNGLRLLEIRPP